MARVDVDASNELTIVGKGRIDTPKDLPLPVIRAFLHLPVDGRENMTMKKVLRKTVSHVKFLDVMRRSAGVRGAEDLVGHINYYTHHFAAVRYCTADWSRDLMAKSAELVEEISFKLNDIRGFLFYSDATRLIKLWDSKQHAMYYQTTAEFQMSRGVDFIPYFDKAAGKEIKELSRARDLLRSEEVYQAEVVTAERKGDLCVSSRSLFVYDKEQAEKFASARGLALLTYDPAEVTLYGPIKSDPDRPGDKRRRVGRHSASRRHAD